MSLKKIIAAALLSLCSLSAMAQGVQVPNLPAASALDGTELVPLAQGAGNQTRKATVSQIMASVLANGSLASTSR